MEKNISIVGALLRDAAVAPYVISFLGLMVAGLALYVVLVALRKPAEKAP